VGKKYEEGSQWIRQHIGAVSISFDPFEFLNLTDAKKRQWVIAHSPESNSLSQTALYTFLLARIVENLLGTGIVYSLLVSVGGASLNEFCRQSDGKNLSRLKDRLTEVFHQQEPGLSTLVWKTLDGVFRYWSLSHSAEENSTAMLKHLKSETLRLKNAIREQVAALTWLGPGSARETHAPVISDVKQEIQGLSARIEGLDKRIETIRNQRAAKIKREQRIIFLEENISRLSEKLNGDMHDSLISMRKQLHNKRVDPEPLQDKLNKHNRELSRWSAECQEQESGRKSLAAQIKLKHDQLETLGSSHFACPVAPEIRCDTDMIPYREILAGEIQLLHQEETEVRSTCDAAQQKMAACQNEIDALEARLADQLCLNRDIQREIDLVQEQIQAEEKETASVRGKLMAYREEVSVLESEQLPVFGEEGGVETLEDEKSDLKFQMVEKRRTLDEWLRCQGKIEALSELNRLKTLMEQELAVVKQTFDLLSGIQKEMAAGIAGALETEVNDVLKLIDSDYHFTLNLTGRNFEMGWNRDGKIIPFKTINSAHFVIFIVPFLAALIQRLARTRDKTGLPTLKALCIEAESLTPANLSALLKGLKHMKEKGVLDNVLVAHYHSLRDPKKLSGFQEHILEKAESQVEAISL
jgi:hypothetical protein